MPTKTAFSDRLSLRFPLVVAPLGGGPTTPELVAASSNAGALGSLAAAYLPPEGIRAAIDETRRLTDRPFAVNLFTPMPKVAPRPEAVAAAVQATSLYRAELDLPEPKVAPPYHPDFDRQFEVVLRARPAVFSFVFGLLDRGYLDECRRAGILTVGGATTLAEALALEASGVDAIVAQGVEAGGHRCSFQSAARDPGIGTIALTRSLAGRLKVPVIAAGGIMDGAGIAAALRAGAQAVQLGTVFLLCKEAATSAPYRAALALSAPRLTRLTRAFSGRWARGIENRFLLEMENRDEAILPFPAQNAFTRDLRARSAERGSADFLSLWAGTGVERIRSPAGAGELIAALVAEAEQALA